MRQVSFQAEANTPQPGEMNMTATESKTVTVKCKAFSGGRIQSHRCIVDADGSVRVYDDVAGYYTTCHSMSERTQARVRKLAAK